jgi:L-fuconolactonase
LRIDSHVIFSPGHPPEHLQAILTRNKFDGALLVVDDAPFPETGPHILGLIVRRLSALDRSPLIRGLCTSLTEGIPEIAQELAHRGLPLDLEMRPADFPALLHLAERFPNLRIAIDHLARPAFYIGISDEWLHGMESASRLPNVYCKISGLLAEGPLPWSSTPIRPFVQYALSTFGPRRLMFGSEWPVRLPGVTWKESLAAFTQSIGVNPIEVREQLLGGTAAEFYAISPPAHDTIG